MAEEDRSYVYGIETNDELFALKKCTKSLDNINNK